MGNSTLIRKGRGLEGSTSIIKGGDIGGKGSLIT